MYIIKSSKCHLIHMKMNVQQTSVQYRENVEYMKY